jgi:hypothetical protein
MPTAPAAAADATAASSLHDRLWSAVPSVTSDGSLILVPVSGPFFARWEPNLLFVVWDRHGKVVQQQVVQDMEQDLSERGTPEVRAQVKAQELAAGKLLDALERKGLQSKDLQPAVLESDNAPFPHHAAYTKEGERAPSVTFDLSPTGTLTIKPRGHAAVTRHHAGWRSVPTPEQERRIQESISKGENGCYNPALLRGALVDLGRRIAIVTIGYHGSDSCWEGPDEQTVMAW